MSVCAILYEPSAFTFREKVMGRQAAGAAFMQALADRQFEEVSCYARSREAAQDFAGTLTHLGAPRTGVRWIPFDQPNHLARAGVLYRADPILGPHAWHRLTQSTPRSYSLCGLTHTISSHGPMSSFCEWLTAPLEAWDAVICTSRGARDAVRHVVEAQAEHLAERLGATRFTLPQLPVIPLGVHTRKFASTSEVRQAARQRLGLAEDEVAVLFAGRLIVHGKAHPLAMYLALEQAAQGRKVVLIQAGQAPNSQILRIFVDEPARFCPSVRVVMVDGANFDLYRAAWSAADIFTSLSDNIQETFGLTPIEAMAAGLPVVVSDWDGYKDTVRHGIDGFRVPTLSPQPGQGAGLADRYDLELINFDYYSAYVSQLVAVDVEGAAVAYRELIDNADLRARMGAAGARRAQEVFDWSVIFRRYLELWEELGERRRSDPQLTPVSQRRQRPDRADPFSVFATYPTSHIEAATTFRLRSHIEVVEAISRRDLASTGFAKFITPEPAMIQTLLAIIGSEWMTFASIVLKMPGARPEAIECAMLWLSKVGVLDFRI